MAHSDNYNTMCINVNSIINLTPILCPLSLQLTLLNCFVLWDCPMWLLSSSLITTSWPLYLQVPTCKIRRSQSESLKCNDSRHKRQYMGLLKEQNKFLLYTCTTRTWHFLMWHLKENMNTGFSLRILVARERCNITGEYFERGSTSEQKIVIGYWAFARDFYEVNEEFHDLWCRMNTLWGSRLKIELVRLNVMVRGWAP